MLRGTPGVGEAVVVKRDPDALVAYVTSATRNPPDAGTLRTRLRLRADRLLPEFERPSTYVVLPSMPLNRNGKIDRTALPEPPATRPETSTAYVAATQPAERRLAAIFTDLLGVDQVGLHDDFIELGGDSLLAAQAAHRIGDGFGVHAPIRIVFDLPTVAGLTGWLTTAPTRIQEVVVARPPEPDGRLPFTDLQHAAVAHDLATGRNVVTGPDYALSISYQISGPLNVDALGDAVDELVNRHAALRTALHMRPGEGYQVIGPATTGLLRTAGPGTRLADLIRAEPLEPASGRVFAADLISDDDVEHTLSLRAHHMIADDLSTGLIEQELTRLYEGFRTGHGSGLAPAPDYRAVIGQPVPAPSAAELAYWTKKFEGATPIELVPEELLGKDSVGRHTRITNIVVPAAEFLQRVRRNRVTLHAALYAMTHALLAADSSRPDMLLYTVNAARRNAEMARTVGMFSDAVLVRQQNPDGLFFEETLRRAAEELNVSYRHARASTPALCQIVPDMVTVLGKSQLVVFETIATTAGLRLAGCSILRSEPGQDDHEELEYQDPAGLNVLARQEGTSLRLMVTHDTAFVPVDYADRLLHRLQKIVMTYGPEGDRPMSSLVSADPWLRAR
nr:condensation domain-containing protein [Kutzneria buriramensis]